MIEQRLATLAERTRGGLASALVEIAEAAQVQIQIDERSILVGDDVQGACEILGLDPLYVANEGRFVCTDHVAGVSRIQRGRALRKRYLLVFMGKGI